MNPVARSFEKSGVIAVIGASGFIGRHVMALAARKGIGCVGVVRSEQASWASAQRIVEDFRDHEAMAIALNGVGTIIHLADEASRHSGDLKEPISATIARVAQGRRIIFASSIYARLDEEGQKSEYGRRKRKQEDMLLAAGNVVFLRLPPVHGDGCGGSFALLQKAVVAGIPLPFGMATSPRSYLSVENLAELLLKIATSSGETWDLAKGRAFEPEGAVRISTRDLAHILASRSGKKARLVPIPRAFVDLGARLVGRSELASGAFDSLESRDNSALTEMFGWLPTDELTGNS